MAFIEVVALLVVGSVLIAVFMSVGRPMAEMLENKTRYKLKALDSEAEERLLKRVEALEEELRQAQKQIVEIKEASDFAMKMIESKIESKLLEHKSKNS